ncbi:hypothetical protein [Paraburkholderia youngii]|uniref:hypothetical protein n=1 Tax=Paraburkholderia youngii TaxID=2782701 RepID=UPI003D202C80
MRERAAKRVAARDRLDETARQCFVVDLYLILVLVASVLFQERAADPAWRSRTELRSKASPVAEYG